MKRCRHFLPTLFEKAVQSALVVASPFHLRVFYHFQESTKLSILYDIRRIATHDNATKIIMMFLQESIELEKDIMALLKDIWLS